MYPAIAPIIECICSVLALLSTITRTNHHIESMVWFDLQEFKIPALVCASGVMGPSIKWQKSSEIIQSYISLVVCRCLIIWGSVKSRGNYWTSVLRDFKGIELTATGDWNDLPKVLWWSFMGSACLATKNKRYHSTKSASYLRLLQQATILIYVYTEISNPSEWKSLQTNLRITALSLTAFCVILSKQVLAVSFRE